MLLILSCLFLTPLAAQSSWSWAESFGAADMDQPLAMATDAAGNSFVTGVFNDAVAFGSTVLTSTNAPALFVARFSPAGTCTWAKKYSPSYGGFAIGIDAADNSYVISDAQSHSILKYDSSGNLLWTQPVPSRTLHVAPSGEFWIAGASGSPNDTLVLGADTLIGPCNYVVRYDSTGAVMQVFRFGNGALYPSGIGQDGASNMYVAGEFGGNFIINSQAYNGGPGSHFLLVKLDTAGNFLWEQHSVTNSSIANGTACSISVDKAGNCYLGYNFLYDDAWIGTDTIQIDTPNEMVGALMKFDVSGNLAWLKQSDQPQVYGNLVFATVTCDSAYVYLGGTTQENFMFDSVLVTNSGGANAFVIVLDEAGTLQLMRETSKQNSTAFAVDIGVDAQGGIYFTGSFGSTVFFGTDTLTNAGNNDIFLAKIQTSPTGISSYPFTPQAALFGSSGGQLFQLQLSEQALRNNGLRFRLYDTCGRMVKEIAVSEAQTTIDCSDLAPGVYSWSVENSSQRFASGKLVN